MENIQKCEYCHCEHNGTYGSGRFCSKHCRMAYIGTKSHQNRKSNNNHKTFHKKIEIKEYICPYCNKKFNKTYFQFAAHIKWCKNNPNREKYIEQLQKVHRDYRGHIAWNRGLTKDTDKRILEGVEKLKNKYASGEIINHMMGKHHSQETKKKLSILGRINAYQRKCKKTMPYLKKDGSIVNLDSSYERMVACFLDSHNIEWTRPKPLSWMSPDGKTHNYFPDFYIVKANIYLDPKNHYCFKVQKEKIQYIKEHYHNVIFLTKEQLADTHLQTLLESFGINFN